MADAGVGEGILIASALAGTAASVYSATQAGGAPKAPKLPDVPKSPDDKSAASSLAQADVMARTAGGTLLSKPGQQPVGDGANAVRKTLLGT